LNGQEVTKVAPEGKNPLSSELKVAVEIYHCEINNWKVWLGKLVERLDGEVSKNTISEALDTLFDWGIVKAEYGPTDTGKPGRLYKISNEERKLIKELYERYWKTRYE
jgi:DNA-binding transcriptional ArsR family regulator